MSALALTTLLGQAAPPVPIKTFCASLKGWQLFAKGGKKHGEHSDGDVCMDFATKSWSRYVCRGPDTHMTCRTTIFNGTDQFDLSIDPSAPGGYTCITKTLGPPPDHSFPFNLLEIDADAVLNGTEANIDGFSSVEVWKHQRTTPMPGAPPLVQEFTWLVENTTAPPHELIQSHVSHQSVDSRGQTQYLETIRDWTANFTTKVPGSAFAPPPGVVCKKTPGTLLADSYSWGA